MIPPQILESWGLKEDSMVEVRPVNSGRESRESEIAFIEGLIGLWREEEERLRAMVADSSTSPEVKSQANARLVWIQQMITQHQEELALLGTR
jgi:hypothetical protein